MSQQLVAKSLGQTIRDRTVIARKIDDADFFLSVMDIPSEKRLALKEKAVIQEKCNYLKKLFTKKKSSILDSDLNQKAVDILVKIIQLQKRLGAAQPKLWVSIDDQLLRELSCKFAPLDVDKLNALLEQGASFTAVDKYGIPAINLLCLYLEKNPVSPELINCLIQHKGKMPQDVVLLKWPAKMIKASSEKNMISSLGSLPTFGVKKTVKSPSYLMAL